MPAGGPRSDAALPVRVYVAIGANLGDAQASVHQAIHALDKLPQTRLAQSSSLYRTAPIVSGPIDPAGPDAGLDYINAVVALDTALPALELLAQLQALEQAAGRERPYQDAPRTLDLDLLLYGKSRIDSSRLTVPHPRMWQRAFVLVPLAEIAPELVPPGQLDAVAAQAAQAITRLDLGA
ncbi:MAG: 2-amino-4-hydroxy-6-hydroxymethyldihydropteridine diphosphokinase [Polaromonas sp.]|uniref:2-amino-4-hydroxy-6- hydroxymethyldihydropteridine diphosphokinase n=1 Tax=Polaromonas sp. TaxID=1869339 RepID=UPI002735BB75|nr:2-amino-4-hydroxy-6-hydroxymethyldihydropteridine diphosphokinase [Polaromonas sp.]MDP2818830.1 2-amino-4-hydroxy-6-hydroxymethyldihydropteridine diphosphokinase [Polaromonas sp.]